METGPDGFYTDVMNHLQSLNLSLQWKDKIMSDLAKTICSFQNKIKLFQRDINARSLQHLPLLKCLVNYENKLCSEKIKVYVDSMVGDSTNFATRFSDLENLKPTFAFLGNPFVVDAVKDGCPVQKPIATPTANIEAELLYLQQDFALKSVHQ